MTENLLLYLAKVALGSTLMLVFYFLFYRKETFYKRNRVYLNLTMLLPMLIPLININSFFTNPKNLSEFTDSVPTMVTSSFYIESSISTSIEKISFSEGLFSIYLAGLIISIGALIWGVYSILKIIRMGKEIRSNGATFTLSVNQLPPFSFFKNIVISKNVYTEEDYPSIISHELAHIEQKHYVDLMFCELFVAFQWFNPAAWLLRKAIKENHEFLADNEVASKCQSIKQYQFSLLGVSGIGRTYPLVHNFNKRIIKKRIIMMNKVKTKSFAKLKNFLVAPIVAILILSISACNQADTVKESDADVVKESHDQVKRKLSEESTLKVRKYIQINIMYPKEAALANKVGEVYIMVDISDGLTRTDVITKDEIRSEQVIGEVVVTSYKTEGLDLDSSPNGEHYDMLSKAAKSCVSGIGSLEIPEWEGDGAKFVVKINFQLQ